MLGLLGCSNGTNAPGCVSGQRTLCACADGSSGVQTCLIDNSYAACECAQPTTGSPAQGATVSPPATGGGAAPPVAGQAGTGGSAPGGPPAGSGGMGATGGSPATGGVGGAGGRSGAGGGAAVAPADYGYCTMTSQCAAGAACAMPSNGRGGGGNAPTAGYCSPPCSAGRQCPQPQGGSVTANCIAGACFLGSCQQADCPTGMTCIETKLGPTSVFSCEYPAR